MVQKYISNSTVTVSFIISYEENEFVHTNINILAS